MKQWDNYAVQASNARELFLTYDHAALAEKLHAQMDDAYLYTVFLSEKYRLSRVSGNIERFYDDGWISANSFSETLTLLDLVCDSRADRSLTFRWKHMSGFGLQFHQNLLENARDANAEIFEARLDSFRNACVAYGGKPYAMGDASYIFELFDGLCVVLQLWFADEDFPAQIRWYWDENALQYLKYETMYYAIDLVLNRILEHMDMVQA